MGNKRVLWISAYVLAAAVLIGGIAVVIRDQTDSSPAGASAADLPDLAAMPYPSTLTLNGPAAGSIGSQFSLSAQGYSERPIKTVSLYDGATRISTTQPPGPGNAQVTYPALSVGPHALHAEVTDDEGKVSLTPVVPVAVHAATNPAAIEPYAPAAEAPAAEGPAPAAPAPEGAVSVPVPVDEGESPEGLAARLHLEPSQIRVVQVPDLGQTEPIPKGAVVLADVKPDAGLTATIGDIATVTNPNATAGTKLKLSGKADGCGVILTVKGANGPVQFFDANGGVPGWASVGETDGNGTLALPAPPPGAHTYVARTDSTQSLPVSVAIPLKCSGNAGWTGDAKIIEGILYLPPKAVGAVIVYLTLDSGTSIRIPEQDAIDAGYETDIADKLPVLTGRSVQLQVWKATEFDAQQVANGSLTVPEGTELSSVIGEPGRLTLTASAPDDKANKLATETFILDEHDDATFTFEWEAQSSRVDEVLYRVYTSIPGPSSLTGPAIFASGISERTGDGSTSTGSFTIDTADIPGHEAVAQRLEQIEAEGSKAMPSTETAGLDIIEGVKAYTPPATAQTLGKLDGFTASTPTKVGTQIDPQLLQPSSSLPGPGDQIYVDVVANPNGPAVGTTSNNVGITLPTPVPAEDASSGVTLEADELVLDPGRAPNPTMGNCAAITLPSPEQLDAYFGGKPNAGFGPTAFYPEGDGTYCLVPGQPESCALEDVPVVGGYACELGDAVVEGIDAFVEVLLQYYDLGTQIYNGAIKGVVDIIATFNPICLVITAGDENAGKSCEMVAGMVAHAAITAVLASFGLPPALPSITELEALAEGELAIVAVALMKQAGIPCDDVQASPELAESLQTAGGKLGAGAEAQALSDPCLALAAAVLDSVIAKVKQTASQQMAATTGMADFSYIPGFQMKPDERSLPSPMTVTYSARVQKFDAQSSGLVCRVAMLPSAPSRGQGYPYPFSFPGPGAGQGQSIALTESDDPVFGNGVYSGSGVLSNYAASGSALADVLAGLDEQMSVRAEGQCVGGKATTNATVRPYEK